MSKFNWSWTIGEPIKREQPQQRYVFETLKLDAGTHTWLERMRVLEEQQIFHGREIIITEGKWYSGLKKTYIG